MDEFRTIPVDEIPPRKHRGIPWREILPNLEPEKAVELPARDRRHAFQLQSTAQKMAQHYGIKISAFVRGERVYIRLVE